MSLKEFNHMKYDRDILVRIIIKKDGRRAAYAAQRRSGTDFPLIACCVAEKEGTWYVSAGARPFRAEVVEAAAVDGRVDCRAVAERFRFGNNTRGSAEYRKHLTEVYTGRLIKLLGGEV